MSKVTVVVPSYNHEKYVLETLNSIKNQTFTDFNVIIIDDASKDKTAEIIESFLKENELNWTFIKRENNKGLVYNVNEAFNLSQSEYISLIASDDFWAPTKLEKQVKVLEEDDSIAMVFNDYYDMDENSQVFNTVIRNKRYYTYHDIASGKDLPPASLIFRKNKLTHNFSDIEKLCVEDLFIWLSCLSDKKSKAYVLDETLSYYRLHRNNTAKRIPIKLLDQHYITLKYFQKPKNEFTDKYCAAWALRNFNALSRHYKRESLYYLKRSLILFYKFNFWVALGKLILLWF